MTERDFIQLSNNKSSTYFMIRGMAMGYEGIAATQPFYVADKTLVIFFDLYDLLPYAYGIPYFPISVYSMMDLLNEDGPLGSML
ncbi:RsiV family protein [Salicibibacter kimchii]|nr:RsiV family protein [Salicibibacter kimchii]